MALSGRRGPVVRNSQSNKFNPRLIFSQIVAIQCFHYLFLGLLLQINYLLFGTSISLSRIFSDKYLGIWTWEEWGDTFAFLVAQVGVGSLLMAIVVEKSNTIPGWSTAPLPNFDYPAPTVTDNQAVTLAIHSKIAVLSKVVFIRGCWDCQDISSDAFPLILAT